MVDEAGSWIRDRIDPEVREGVDAFHSVVGSGGMHMIKDLATRREIFDNMVREGRKVSPPSDRVAREDHTLERDGAEIDIRVFRPRDAPAGPLPGLLYIHGGGMTHGSIESEEQQTETLVERVGCLAASVAYRLAPENPHPIPFEDCYAALVWLADNADRLGVDPERIGVFGGSAGGGLAAAVALGARDRGGPKLVFQALIYPMIDDRQETPSSYEIDNIGLHDRIANTEAWHFLLGEEPGGDGVSPYAAAARAESLAGLPPTYIECGELDSFRDETIEYAARLMRNRVPTELFVYPNAVHGSEFLAPGAALGKRVLDRRLDGVRRGLFAG